MRRVGPVLQKIEPVLENRARDTIRRWLRRGERDVCAAQAGHKGPWLSKWLGNDQDATVDEIAALGRHAGFPITRMLDIGADEWRDPAAAAAIAKNPLVSRTAALLHELPTETQGAILKTIEDLYRHVIVDKLTTAGPVLQAIDDIRGQNTARFRALVSGTLQDFPRELLPTLIELFRQAIALTQSPTGARKHERAQAASTRAERAPRPPRTVRKLRASRG